MKGKKEGAPLPQIPLNMAELDRAFELLGNRIKNELTDKRKNELEQLLGAYPSVPQATEWKGALSKHRKEWVAFMEQLAADCKKR